MQDGQFIIRLHTSIFALSLESLWCHCHLVSERKRNRDEGSGRLGEWDKNGKKYWQESHTNDGNRRHYEEDKEMNVGNALSGAPYSQPCSYHAGELLWATLPISVALIERLTELYI